MGSFEILGRLGLDGSDFTSGLRKAETEGQGFGRRMQGALAPIAKSATAAIGAAFSISMVTEFGREVVQSVGRIKDLSDQFQATTDEVQELDFAAKKSGLSFENFGTALGHIAEARQSAIDGNQKLERSFARLGVSADQLRDPQVRTVDLLYQISKGLEGSNLNATEMGYLLDVLGVKSLKTAEALKELSKVKDLAPKIPKADLDNIEKLNKELELLKLRMEALAAKGMGPVAEAINKDGLLASFAGLAVNPAGFLADALTRKRSKPTVVETPPSGVGPKEPTTEEWKEMGKAHDAIKKSQLELDHALEKVAFDKMTHVEKEAKLQEDIKKAKAEAIELDRKGEIVEANGKRTAAAEKELELLHLQKQDSQPDKTSDALPFVSDALAKVGGFTGSAGLSDPASLLNTTNDYLRQIEGNTRRELGGSPWP